MGCNKEQRGAREVSKVESKGEHVAWSNAQGLAEMKLKHEEAIHTDYGLGLGCR